MTLHILTEEDEQRQLKVTVDVPEERVQEEMRRKARVLARDVRVPGFRPGKAPYKVIVGRIGEEALRAEAVEDLLQPVFEEMLTELAVDPYGQPSLENMEVSPLQFQFTIPLEPVVDLGDYRSIRLEMESVEVTDEAVEDALDHIRTHHETVEPVDRPAEEGDVLTVSGHGEYTGDEGEAQTLIDEERTELLLDPELTFKGTAFVENLLGLEAGDEKQFSVTFPEDYADETLAGKEASFELTVLDVKRRELPALDDELAQLEGEYETLDELREALRENLEEQARQQVRADFFDSMMEKIREGATLVYPPSAVKDELDGMVQNVKSQATRAGWEWDDYLRLQGETEASLIEQWRDTAVERVERNLVLVQLVRDEKLSLSENAVEEAIDSRLQDFEDEELRQQMRNYLASGGGFERLSNELVLDMIFDRLEAIGKGEAPDLDALEAEAEESEEETEAEPTVEGEVDETEAPETVAEAEQPAEMPENNEVVTTSEQDEA